MIRTAQIDLAPVTRGSVALVSQDLPFRLRPERCPAVTTQEAESRNATGRVALIDGARGLFLFWMVTAHALGLAGVRDTSPLAFLIPPQSAWLSERFVVLSGFTVAWVFAERALAARAVARRLWKRAGQLAVIAYLSNAASACALDLLGGTLTPETLGGVLRLDRPWSISWVLLPTVVLLLLAPAVLEAAKRVGATGLFASATILGLLFHGPARFVLEALERNAVGAALHLDLGRLFGIVLVGLWGLTLALVVRRVRLLAFAEVYAVSSVAVFAAGYYFHVTPFVGIVSRFGLLLGVAALIFVAPGTALVRATLQLLGRNALLVFIGHRLLEQTQRHALARVLGPEATAAAVTATTLAILFAVCHYRESHAALSTRLKRVGL